MNPIERPNVEAFAGALRRASRVAWESHGRLCCRVLEIVVSRMVDLSRRLRSETASHPCPMSRPANIDPIITLEGIGSKRHSSRER